MIHRYYDNQDFIEAHTNLIAKYYKLARKIGKPRVLFSAHSLPLSIIKRATLTLHR